MNSTNKSLYQFSRCLAVAGFMAFTLMQGVMADTGKTVSVDIKAQDLATALAEFGRQTSTEIGFSPDAVEAKQAKALKGKMTTEQALDSLLQDSGLSYEVAADGLVIITSAVQDKSSAVEKSGQRVIEEVIVTATKRETSLQDTAMSITALGSEEIERRGLVGMGDYLNSVPGASLLEGPAGVTSLVVRGVSTDPQGEGYSNGNVVGLFLGETPITGLSSFFSNPDIKLVDIERVEVLRGPQGTLYGSGSLGGAVRTIPARPNLKEFGGQFDAGYSHTGDFGSGNSNFQGVINIPLIDDKLAIRAVGYHYRNSGYYKNIGANDPDIATGVATWGAVAATERDDVGNDEYTGGRITLLWEPTDKFSVNLMYHHQEIDQDGWPVSDIELGEGDYLQRGYKMRLSVDGNTEFNESFGDEINIANATVEYDFGWASLLSATSRIEDTSKIYREAGSLFYGFIPVSNTFNYYNDAFIQEVRLTSQFEGPFQFSTGVYYEDITNKSPLQGLYGGDPANNPFTEVLLFDMVFPSYAVKQKAIYGEVYYEFTEKLKLTLGTRLFDYNRKETVTSEQPSDVFPFSGIISEAEGGDSSSSYKISLDYTPNENALFYATWAQGFRLGRPVYDAPFCDADADGLIDGTNITSGRRTLDSDILDSYELGGKISLLENRLQLNTAIYQIDWKKIPVPVVADSCTISVSAGEARIRGAEFEGTFLLSDSLLFKFGASYSKGEVTEVGGDGVLVNGINDGDRLPGTPKYNFNLGLQYDFTIVGLESYFRGDYYYVGGFYHTLDQSSHEIGKYGKLNVRTGIILAPLTIEIYANNLANEKGLTWIDGGSIPSPRGYYLRPRTVGLNVSYKF